MRIPKHCPACTSLLDRSGPNLYCRNSKCSAVQGKVLETFSKTLKIRGLGPATLDKLKFTDIMDIYRTSEQRYCKILGFVIGTKIYREIKKSMKLNMSQVLPALSIPLVGTATTEKLAQAYSSLKEVYVATDVDKHIGPAASSKLRHWLECNKHIWEYLPQSDKFDTSTEYNKIVCISGRLKSFKTKAEAAKVLRRCGYKTTNSMSSKVDILINEGGKTSSKTQQAEKFGIPIVTDIKELTNEWLD